jgi:hypothetical protein
VGDRGEELTLLLQLILKKESVGKCSGTRRKFVSQRE